MLNKEIQPVVSKKSRKKASVKIPTLDAIFEKNGDYDGRLFMSRDKVTYTYCTEAEVMVLHFDKSKGELFFKGHHINSLVNDEAMAENVAIFRKALLKEKKAASFLEAFDQAVEQIKNGI